MLSAAGIGGFGFLEYEKFTKQRVSESAPKMFEIKKGSSFKRVATDLEAAGIIKPAWQFQLLAKIKKQGNKIKAGEFAIDPGMSAEDILNRFVAGKTLSYSSRIVEGYKFTDLVANIKKDPNLVQTLTDADYADIMKTIGSLHKKPEGWFWEICEKYRNTDIWYKDKDTWKIKDFLISDWNWIEN